MSLRPVPHSINNRLDNTKAEKYRPKLITLANSFCAYRRRKRTSSSPSGRVPSSLIKFSPEECTICVMHQITNSSRTRGTRPDSKDSTPRAELFVRLLLPFVSITFSSLFSFLLSFKGLVRLNHAPMTYTSLNMHAHNTWGLLVQKLIIIFWAVSSPHMCFSPYVPFLRHYMHRYDLSFGQAGLPSSCAYALRSRLFG